MKQALKINHTIFVVFLYDYAKKTFKVIKKMELMF